jgi:hypothetical protein
MNGNDRFLNVNDAHLRVTGGNVHASSFNLDQISITTTSTTASTIDFLNEKKAFNARSNIEVGTANLFVDTTTSNVGIRTSSPEYALDVHGPANVSVLTAASNVGILTTSPEYALDVHGTANVGVLTANTITGSGGTLLLGSHLIPTQHQQFDIGSAEYKIRHLYLSNNSLWIGDDSKISVVDGKMKFLKRDKNIVPSGTEALGGNATDALAHAQNSNPGLGLTNINQMKLEHWLAYTRSLSGGADKDIKDIFTDATGNYEATSASDAFKEHGDDIYSVNKLRLGSAAAAGATLDVVGTIKATSDLTVNTDTFHVDATNSRVGVGTTSPAAQLEIHGIGQTSETTFDQSGSMGGVLALKSDDGAAGSGGAVMFGSHAGFHAAIKASLEDGTSNTRGRLAFFTRSNTTDTTMSHAMTIADGGNVGVGTTAPGATLDIRGSTSDPSTPTVHIGDNVADQGDYGMVNLVRDPTNGGSKAHLAFIRNGNTIFSQGYYNNTNTFGFWPSFSSVENTPAIAIDTAGNVGFGTTTINERLKINGNIGLNWSNDTRIIMNYDNSYRQGIEFDAGTRNMTLFSTTNDSGGSIIFKTRGGAGSSDTDYGTERMRISKGGDVGINESDPDSTLHVKDANGTARIIVERVSDSGECNLTLRGLHSGGNTEWQIYHAGQTAALYFWRGSNRGYISYNASNTSLNFTGQHRTFIKDTPFTQAETLEGLIVSSNQNKYIRMSGGIEAGSNAVTINEALPVVTVSSTPRDKKCFGVISLSEDPETREEKHGNFTSIMEKEDGDTRIYINSVGEGGIWVSNTNGTLEAGDYITTSALPGYGMKQDDDLLHNYTVAKITMDCDFNPSIVPIQKIKKIQGIKRYWRSSSGEETTEEKEGFDELIEREELVNDLDEHGQIQWENHPTETEKAYKIRYLDANGNITDETNAVHKAAFVGCTYHCG